MARRHVGGSLLPSSEPRILQPVVISSGTLQVRVITELNMHGLFHQHELGATLLATHPNGYSCFELLQRLLHGDRDRACQQIEYIMDCGGTARRPAHILSLMTRAVSK